MLSTKLLRQGWMVLLILCSSGAVAHSEPARQIQEALLTAPLASAASTPINLLTTSDLAGFYAHRGYQPAWTDSRQLEELQATIDDLSHDGLRPSDYSLPAASQPTDPFSLCRELTTSQAYLQALLHLHFGRLDRETVEPLWRHSGADWSQHRQALLELSATSVDQPAEAFAAARPFSPAYTALRQAYIKHLGQIGQTPWPSVSQGPLLRPDTVDPRVIELRQRLVAAGYDTGVASNNAHLYDDALQQAVIAFQHDHFLAEDGLVGPATLRALNRPHEAVLDQLLANLERLRWRQADMEANLLLVDIAGARASYYEADQETAVRIPASERDATTPVWEARTQVGTRQRQTPALKSVITHFTFNPSWTVPPTILRHDKIPEIRRNPDYLARNHMEVLDSDGRPLDPAQIDWARPGAIMLRQTPGPHNALGRVAIRFPNPFSVYLHDTPSQRLFTTAQRTYSSGCVRVEAAMTLVDRMIAHGSEYSAPYISRVLDSGRTGNIHLSRPITLLMDYWTADIDHHHHVILRPDIYHQDPALAETLRDAPAAERPWPCPSS